MSQKNLIQQLSTINWEFTGTDTQYLTHSFHQYPARFIPQIPKMLIQKLSKPEDTTLDPFCGCGTTLVESQLLNRNAIGIDLNPLACLISKVKSTPIDNELLTSNWIEFHYKIRNSLANNNSIDFYLEDRKLDEKIQEEMNTIKLPTRRKSGKFTEEIIREIITIRNALNEITHKDIVDFFKVGLSSSIYACFETRSKKFNLWNTFSRKIQNMINKMEQFKFEIDNLENTPEISIYESDARKFPSTIIENSVDLVITSPTYVNVFDYYRIHIYNMIFLELDYEKISKFEMGAHRFHKENRFRLLTHYLVDLFRTLNELIRVTDKQGYICFVVGDSCIEFERIATHKHLIQIAKALGLTHLATYERKIDSSSKYSNRYIANIKNEYILIFQNKKNDFAESLNKVIEQTIKEILEDYQKHIDTSKGTCLRYKNELSLERLMENKIKIKKAIEKISKDLF